VLEPYVPGRWVYRSPSVNYRTPAENLTRIVWAWLAQSDVPKLFVNAEPGAITRGRVRDFVRSWPHQTEVTVPASISSRRTAPRRSGLRSQTSFADCAALDFPALRLEARHQCDSWQAAPVSPSCWSTS
jgi:hypothetical protein